MCLCLCVCLRAFLSVALSFIFYPTITGGPKHGVRGCQNRDRVSLCRSPSRRCAHTLVCAFVYGCARLYACKLYTYACMVRKICVCWYMHDECIQLQKTTHTRPNVVGGYLHLQANTHSCTLSRTHKHTHSYSHSHSHSQVRVPTHK